MNASIPAAAGSAAQASSSGFSRPRQGFGTSSYSQGPYQKRAPDRSRVRCHNCAEWGPYANECPKSAMNNRM